MRTPFLPRGLVIAAWSLLPFAALPAQRSHVVSTDLPLYRAEAFDFAFRVPPTAVAGFTRIRLVNHGPSTHDFEMTKIPDTATMAGIQKMFAGPFENVMNIIKDWGGPSNARPNDSTEAIVELKPGRYMLTCWVIGKDHKPHAMVGMISMLDVKAATGRTAAQPVEDLVLHASDYKFEWSKPVTRGPHLVRFQNDGPVQEHDVQIVKLHPGQTMKTILAWAHKGLVGPPPGTLAGGSVGIDFGSRVWFPIDLSPGRYAMFCYVPDRKDNKEHILHGMWKEFTVR